MVKGSGLRPYEAWSLYKYARSRMPRRYAVVYSHIFIHLKCRSARIHNAVESDQGPHKLTLFWQGFILAPPKTQYIRAFPAYVLQ